jgi:hypothetical protein
MTPWEAKLLKWKTSAGTATFEARFVTDAASEGPLAKSIAIEIRTKNHPALKDTDLLRIVSFDPLTGRVYDRLAYGIEKSAKLGPERKPYTTRPEYGQGVTAHQQQQQQTGKKPADVALNDYTTALERLQAGEAAPANPSAQAADTAYRTAITALRQGNPIGMLDPAEIAAGQEYNAAVVKLQAGQPVGAGLAAQAAQADYDDAVVQLAAWHPVNGVGGVGAPPNTIALSNSGGAQTAVGDYRAAWTNLYAGTATATNGAALAAKESFNRMTKSKTKRD